MNRTTLVAAAAALSFAGCLAAQSIHAQGTLRQQAGGFRLDEMPVPIVAPGVDLVPFAGRIVELTGALQDQGGLQFVVDTVARATSTFVANGNPRVGRTLQVRVDAQGSGLRCLYAALAPNMFSLDLYSPLATGVLWLDLPTLATIDVGAFSQSRTDLLPVPNAPELVGLEVWLQASVLLDPAGPLRFLNGAHVTVQP